MGGEAYNLSRFARGLFLLFLQVKKKKKNLREPRELARRKRDEISYERFHRLQISKTSGLAKPTISRTYRNLIDLNLLVPSTSDPFAFFHSMQRRKATANLRSRRWRRRTSYLPISLPRSISLSLGEGAAGSLTADI